MTIQARLLNFARRVPRAETRLTVYRPAPIIEHYIDLFCMSTYIFLTFVTNFENVFAFFVTCLAQNISVKLHAFLINIYVIECWHEILFGASIILHNELYFENSLTTKINFGAPNVSMKVKLEKRHRTNFSRSHPLAACIWFPIPRKPCPCHLQQPNFLIRSAMAAFPSKWSWKAPVEANHIILYVRGLEKYGCSKRIKEFWERRLTTAKFSA